MNIKIDIFSDVICPWCYVGKRRLEKALAQLPREAKTDVRWHPFQLNPATPADGVPRREYLSRKFGGPDRLDRMDARLKEVGAAEGLDFRPEKIARTPNTLDAHRLLWLAGRQGHQNTLAENLFRGYFSEGEDIGNRAVLSRIAGASGLDASAAAAFLASEEGRAEVLAEESVAKDAGLNGVPFFIINDQSVLHGAEPPESFLQAIETLTTAPRKTASCDEGFCRP